MTKSCGKCKRDLPLDAFNKNINQPDGLHRDCRKCKKLYQAAWYQKHKEEHRQRTPKWRLENLPALRAWYNDLKSRPCTDCGQSFPPYCMDWDHLPGQTKVIDVASLFRIGNKQAILDEIVKCELVCACCHRIRTHSRTALGKAQLIT